MPKPACFWERWVEFVPVARLLTVQEAAAYLGVKVSWLYEKVRHRDVPSVKLGRLRRFDPEDLSRYVESHKEGAPKTDFGDRRAETLVGQRVSHAAREIVTTVCPRSGRKARR